MEERRAWRQRIHAQLFHQGCPPIPALLTEAGREALTTAELSATGRPYVDTALRRIDELTAEIDPVRSQLVELCAASGRVSGTAGPPVRVGWLCAAIMWAEIGDARRFASSDQLVRFAGLDVTVYSSDGKRSPGHLSRQGSPELRWATSRRLMRGPPRLPGLRLLPQAGRPPRPRQEPDPGGGAQNPAPQLSHAARARRCRPGDAGPRSQGGGRLNALCACPAHNSADARGQLPQSSCRHPLSGWTPRKE